MKFLSTAIAVFVLSTQTTWAEPIEYKCDITKPDSHGWIAPEYYFQIDAETGEAQVVSRHHDWTKAKLKVKQASKYRLLWNVTLPSSEGPNLRMKYQANLDAANSTARVRASFTNVNAANKPFGTGVCKVVN